MYEPNAYSQDNITDPIQHIYKQHLNIAVIVICPIIILSILTIVSYMIIKAQENKTNTLRIVIYHLLQFICLPLLMIFFILNVFLISFSYLFCKKLCYISTKNTMECLLSCFQKLKCKKSVNTIIITKKKMNELPERANKYKDVNNDSKQESTNNQNLNLNKNKPNLFNDNNYRIPPTNKKPKGKFMEFLSKNLISDDNNPVYINLIRNIKNKTKGIKEKNATVNNVIINP
jgi:uncharacterized membrane-anchored protein YitT (DUF2179 family)